METKMYHIIMLIVYLIPVIGFIAAITDEVLSEDVREMSILFALVISVSFGICIFGVVDNAGTLISKEYKLTKDIKNNHS